MRRVAALSVLIMFGCDDSTDPPVGETAPSAVQANQPPPPPADVDVDMPVLAKGDRLPVSTTASSIEFTGAKITKSHDGGFGVFDGVVVIVDDTVVGTEFSIDLTTTTADVPKLTTHLMSKDFFHVEKYGKARFVSSEITPAAEPGAVTHDVRGVLDLHGRQRPLSFPASINVGESATTVTASFDINRQNWGIAYPGKPDNLIKDDVEIRLNLSFGGDTETVGDEPQAPAMTGVESAGTEKAAKTNSAAEETKSGDQP